MPASNGGKAEVSIVGHNCNHTILKRVPSSKIGHVASFRSREFSALYYTMVI